MRGIDEVMGVTSLRQRQTVEPYEGIALALGRQGKKVNHEGISAKDSKDGEALSTL